MPLVPAAKSFLNEEGETVVPNASFDGFVGKRHLVRQNNAWTLYTRIEGTNTYAPTSRFDHEILQFIKRISL